VPGDPGPVEHEAAAAVQCVGQGCRPQVFYEQDGGGRAGVEAVADEVDVVGADQPCDLGVDLGEASELVQFVELGDGDVAGGVLGQDDQVQEADDFVVDELRQFGGEVVADGAVGEPDDEVLNRSGHGQSPRGNGQFLSADRGIS